MKFSKLFGFITAFDINRDKGKIQSPKKYGAIVNAKLMLVTRTDRVWRRNVLVTCLSALVANIPYI